MYILGIHNSGWTTSAALLQDGRLVAGGAEERWTREKYSRAFPHKAIQYCLKHAGIRFEDVDHIALGWNPAINLASRYRGGFSDRLRYAGEWLYSVPNHVLARLLTDEQHGTEQRFDLGKRTLSMHHVNHHDAHAATAYFHSPFERAAGFTTDFYGERATTTWKLIEGARLTELRRQEFPQSLGGFYCTFTELLGFKPDGDEWKVMGLAPYGDPKAYEKQFAKIIRPTDDGGYEMDLSYFSYYNFDVEGFYTPRMTELFGPARGKDDEITQRQMDIAASLQHTLEQILIHCLRGLHAKTKCDDLILSGGVIMNSVFNGIVRSHTPFKRVYIPFSPDDTGNAIGAALLVQHGAAAPPKGVEREVMRHAYWGPSYTDREIEETIGRYKLPAKKVERPDLAAVDRLTDGKIVGWFQGRMEFGQRALGNRSILADPRRDEMKEAINAAVKYREAFRPFAPSILEERTGDWFDIESDTDVPFMEKVYPVKSSKRAEIPAVTHVDGSGRLQTVSKATNPLYHALITEFEKRTRVPVVLNTSFNVQGEPVVCSPSDAIRTFFTCGLDSLILGSWVLDKR
jgi:carbamoyltransferase